MQSVNHAQLDELETELRQGLAAMNAWGNAVLARIDQVRRAPRPPMTGPEVQVMLNLKPTKFHEMVRAGVLRPIAALSFGKGSTQYFAADPIEALRDGREVNWPPGCPGPNEEPDE